MLSQQFIMEYNRNHFIVTQTSRIKGSKLNRYLIILKLKQLMVNNNYKWIYPILICIFINLIF